MNKVYVVTVHIHSDDREAYSKVFSTKEKTIDYIKRNVQGDISIGWILDKDFSEDMYNEDHGNVIMFWDHYDNWIDYVEYMWSLQEIDKED